MELNCITGDFIFSPHKTGVENYHINLFKRLIKDKDYRRDNSGVYLTTFKSKNIASISVRSIHQFSLQNLKFYFKILALIFPMDFILKGNIYICDGLLPYTINKKIKRIGIIHDLMMLRYPENYSLKRKLVTKLYYYRLKKADRIIAVSKTTKNDIVRFLHINPEKIDVIYNGIDIIPNSSKNRNSQEKYLFYIGDFRKNKNVITAIKAYAKLKKRYPDLNFKLAGKKNQEYAVLKKYIDENDICGVDFLGYVSEEEKCQLYRNAFALVFISDFEGFGVPILEAMNYGIPVITSNCSSMKEIADGAAILVDPHDINDVEKGIENILLNDSVYDELVKKGYQRIKQFTWDNAYNQFKMMLKKLEDQE